MSCERIYKLFPFHADFFLFSVNLVHPYLSGGISRKGTSTLSSSRLEKKRGEIFCVSECVYRAPHLCVCVPVFFSLGKEAGGYLTLTSVYIFKSRGSSFFYFIFRWKGQRLLKNTPPFFGSYIICLSTLSGVCCCHTISGAFEASLISPPRIGKKQGSNVFTAGIYMFASSNSCWISRVGILCLHASQFNFCVMDVGEHPFLKNRYHDKEASYEKLFCISRWDLMDVLLLYVWCTVSYEIRIGIERCVTLNLSFQSFSHANLLHAWIHPSVLHWFLVYLKLRHHSGGIERIICLLLSQSVLKLPTFLLFE